MNPSVDLAHKLALISDHWAPRVVARANDYEIKLVTLTGEFVRHSHPGTAELTAAYDDSLLDP